MNPFNRQAAVRIALVSILMAALTSPLAWFMARERAEQGAVALAMEESHNLMAEIEYAEEGQALATHATRVAQTIVGGLYDIAEIYDGKGNKLAEALTSDGARMERLLPSHARPSYHAASYQNIALPDGEWALRIMIPLFSKGHPGGQPEGYFEGVRLVPDWQRQQLFDSALTMALIAAAASLFCGLAIYPVVVRLSADNRRKARELLDSHISIMEALGRAVARRDSDTGAHNYRVAWLAASLGEALDLPRRSMQSLILGSFLHDVGKIGIPDAILLKPGRLDDEEMKIMRTHVAQGEAIVSGIGWLDGAYDVVAGHHEKWNGNGYPRGLAGEDIPLGARIFAIADVFDALCSKRPYKEPMPMQAALDLIQRDAGSHFDAQLVTLFVAMAPALHAQLAECSEADCRKLLEEKLHQHFSAVV